MTKDVLQVFAFSIGENFNGLTVVVGDYIVSVSIFLQLIRKSAMLQTHETSEI